MVNENVERLILSKSVCMETWNNMTMIRLQIKRCTSRKEDVGYE